MKKNKNMAALCVIIIIFISCKNDMDFKALDIDLSEKPDKVIENTPGRLFYSKDIKGWYISSRIPGTIDSIDSYIIAEIPDKKFSFEEGKQVSVSGFCYHIPRDKFDYNKDLYGLGGVEWYYIKITYLK